jgi:hypothetical protein
LPVNVADRTYSLMVSTRQRQPETALASAPVQRGRTWRWRAGGTLVVALAYLPPWLTATLLPLDWRWSSGHWSVDYGVLLSALPGVVLVAWLAPRVACRRRDALKLLIPPWGVRFAWVIGTRLGQLPHAGWPARADVFPVHGRRAARVAVAVNSYQSRRRRRAGGPVLTGQEVSDH